VYLSELEFHAQTVRKEADKRGGRWWIFRNSGSIMSNG
jgi:hypothetical protein